MTQLGNPVAQNRGRVRGREGFGVGKGVGMPADEKSRLKNEIMAKNSLKTLFSPCIVKASQFIVKVFIAIYGKSSAI